MYILSWKDFQVVKFSTGMKGKKYPVTSCSPEQILVF